MLRDAKTALITERDLKNMNVITSSAERLNSLVDDLVKYAFSSVKDETTTVDLNDVLKEVLEDLEIIIKDSKAKIDCDKLPKIKGSKVQMRQLFSNLIINAIKYAKSNTSPEIKIFTEKVADQEMTEEKYFKIHIKDNGIGMNPDHLGKIFTIFQRLHMRDEYSGNGIGLAICKKIMDNHTGKIDVKSSPNGSTFSLYLPQFSY